MDKFDNWVVYQEKLNKITELKQKLNKAVDELAKVNTAYQKYLTANPHKKKKKELTRKVEILREELMKEIPDKFGVG